MKKVILVEDDDAIRDVFNMALDTKYHLDMFTDGQAIMSNSLHRPDLFILDRNISGTNGLELCRYIKNSYEYAQVPVLMLSASPDIEAQAQAAGADGAIQKPFTLQELRSTIQKYTDA